MRISLNEYQSKLASYILEAENNNWVNSEDANTLQSQITKDQLTIGVVGQMNVGKSTLINALVFGKDILPTSETPMTAALTYIDYGESPMAKVEMLSLSDYTEIKDKTRLNITEDNKFEVESALKLLAKIEAIPSYKEMMGETIDISLDDFDEYVGAEGKFTPLVKFLNLTLDNPNLKGIRIVDTPGYNDPVSSRDITTKKFLSQANVIIMVQDVEQYFTRTDVDLIREQIPNSGIGKMIVVLNKKDSISLSDLDKVMKSAAKKKEEIAQNDPEIAPILDACNVIPISGIMSLLGQSSIEEINQDEVLSFWDSEIRYSFPDLCHNDYVQQSGVLSLQDEISNIVLKQKKDLLLMAPCKKLQAFLQAFINKKNIEKESLEETNGFLSDQQIDLESVMEDLNSFELQITEFMDDTISNCDNSTTSKIENVRYALRDHRDKEIQNINFVEKRSKKYLRYCFNEIEEVFFRLNVSYSNSLRQLGNEISDAMHEEIAELERKMNLVVLQNTQLIHSSVIKRISKTINGAIPRTIGENIVMEATFPDYWDRQDIYQIGIRTYFRKMVQDSFSNDHINSITSVYEDVSAKLLDTIEKEIGKIIDETKKQYNASEAIDIETRISDNEKEISLINDLIPVVEEFKNKVSNLIQQILWMSVGE